MAGIRRKSDELKDRIVEVIERFYFENHHSPSMAEMAGELNIGKATVYRYVVEMSHEGRLRYDGKTIRTPKTDKADFSTCCTPIVGGNILPMSLT